jgi:hypothetical protein
MKNPQSHGHAWFQGFFSFSSLQKLGHIIRKESKNMIRCKICSFENDENLFKDLHTNFCRKCGAKLIKECQCWIKNSLYNCGHDKCPGYNLLIEEIKNSRF